MATKRKRNWIGAATRRMKRKGTLGSFGKATKKKIAAAKKKGGKMAAELDYVPLPDKLIKQVRETWKTQIKGVTVASN